MPYWHVILSILAYSVFLAFSKPYIHRPANFAKFSYLIVFQEVTGFNKTGTKIYYKIANKKENKMTLLKFEPFREFDHLTGQIEKFFNTGNSAFEENTLMPSIDIYEVENSLVVEVEAPGLKKENLKLTLEDNILTIEGEKKSVERNNVVRIFRSERTFGNFKRSFTLPVDVDPDKVNAKFENGILTITLQKLETKSVNEKTIELK